MMNLAVIIFLAVLSTTLAGLGLWLAIDGYIFPGIILIVTGIGIPIIIEETM